MELPEGRLAQPENLTFQSSTPTPFVTGTSAPLSVALASGQINLSSPLIDEDSGA